MEQGRPLAMAEVKWQKFVNVYSGDKGLAKGTIFEELALPFLGARAACSMQFNEGRRCRY